MKLSKICSLVCLVVLSLTGCFPAKQVQVSVVNPQPASSYAFGRVYVGTTASSSTYHWKNNSSATINTSALIPLPLGGPFGFTPAFQGQTVNSGQSTMGFTFTFTPTAAGEVTGSAALGIQEIQYTVKAVELKGTGVFQVVGGNISIGSGHLVAGQVLDFGDVMVPGGSPVVKEFKIYNLLGNQPIILNANWSSGGSGFSIINPLPLTIPARGRVTVKLQFAPPAVGEYNDGVTFHDANLFPVHFGGTAVKGRGVSGG